MITRARTAVIAAIALGSVVVPAAGQLYDMTDMGTLGGNFAHAAKINTQQQVVGRSTTPFGGHSFVWLPTASYGLKAGLNPLGQVRLGTEAIANGINSTGQIVGSYDGVAFVWSSAPMLGLPAGMSSLGTFGGSCSTAAAINSLGHIVGQADTVDGSARAFFWASTPVYGYNAGMNPLGLLPGHSDGYAADLNGLGQVVGSSKAVTRDLQGNSEVTASTAVVWLPSPAYGLSAGINMLGVSGMSEANAINASGQIVGTADNSAFLWLPAPAYGLGAGPNALGTLGGTFSSASAINSGGQIVGSSTTADGSLHAFLWQNGGMHDLNSLILQGTGWVLEEATSINDNGDIVGRGLINGETHAFLLTRAGTRVSGFPEHMIFTPNPARGGNPVVGTLLLTGQAPDSGLVISLGSETPEIAVPAVKTVTVPSGASSATFPISTFGVTSRQMAVITASANRSIRIGFDVMPPAPEHMTFNPDPVRGGNTTTGTLILNGTAPVGGQIVNLGSENPNVTAPAVTTVTVPEGATRVTFPINTFGVSARTMGVLTASANGVSIRIGLDVWGPAPEHMTFNPSPVRGGNLTTGTIILNGTAPPGGIVINLGTETPSIAAPVNPTVTVPAGQRTATFPIQTLGVAAPSMGILTASANGASIRIGVDVWPAVPEHMTFNPNPVQGGQQATGTIILNGQAPPGGLVVNLGTENASLAIPVASTVTVPAGQKTATFSIKTFTPGANGAMAVITATANGVGIRIGLDVKP